MRFCTENSWLLINSIALMTLSNLREAANMIFSAGWSHVLQAT